MRQWKLVLSLLAAGLMTGGCQQNRYGIERSIALPPATPAQVWAVAPAVNLSGEAGVDPLLQADLLFKNLQAVGGITALPVNRVAEAYLLLGINGITSPADAAAVCELLGADALVVPSVTLYNPYDPPTMAAAIQVFPARGSLLRPVSLPDADAVRGLTRTASANTAEVALPSPSAAGRQMIQQVGVFDARDGSIRRAAQQYASGRFDPSGPSGDRYVFLVADRYSSFVYHALLSGLMDELTRRQVAVAVR
ncbi:MAG: hypothetical protein AAF561_04790 [Planctomycetota bacterium]